MGHMITLDTLQEMNKTTVPDQNPIQPNHTFHEVPN